MKVRPIVIAAALVALLLLVGVFTFAGPCVHDDGTVATCNEAQHAIAGGALVACVLLFAALITKNGNAVGFVSIVTAAVGVFIVFAPGILFPLCMVETMPCHVVMRPFVLCAGAAISILCIIEGVRCFHRARLDALDEQAHGGSK